MTDYLRRTTDLNDPEVASLFEEVSFWSAKFGSLLFDQIELRGKIEILDVGCGSGFPLFELARVFGPSSRVTGIDLWKEALKRAQAKAKIYNLPNVKILEADAAHQPFPNSSFDLIVSNLGLNNWDNPSAVLTECFRVAKAAARIILTTNIQGHYREFYDVFRETLKQTNKPEYLKRLQAQEAHRGTKQSLCKLVQKAGWKPRKAMERRFQLRFLDGTALLNHSLTRFGFLDGWRSVVSPADERGGLSNRREKTEHESAEKW